VYEIISEILLLFYKVTRSKNY